MKQAGENLKNAFSENINLTTVVKGIAVAYILTVPIFMVFALILMYTDFPEKLISPVVLITTIISVIFAGSMATKNLKSRGWMNGSIVGFIYMSILYLASSLVLRDFSLRADALWIAVISILSGAIGGIVGVNVSGNSRSRHKR